MTRLGSKLPFAEAAEEVWYSHQTEVAETTLRRVTYVNGRAAEAVSRQEVEMLYRDAPMARPDRRTSKSLSMGPSSI